MILIHLLAGLVFGITSVIFSIYAGHGFVVGAVCYSLAGACGMVLSVALSLLPMGGLLQLAVAAVKSPSREGTAASQARHQHPGFGQEIAGAREV